MGKHQSSTTASPGPPPAQVDAAAVSIPGGTTQGLCFLQAREARSFLTCSRRADKCPVANRLSTAQPPSSANAPSLPNLSLLPLPSSEGWHPVGRPQWGWHMCVELFSSAAPATWAGCASMGVDSFPKPRFRVLTSNKSKKSWEAQGFSAQYSTDKGPSTGPGTE